MHDTLVYNRADAVFIKRRIEYNLANNFCFISEFSNGTTHIFARKLDNLRYLNINTLEDVNLQEDLIKNKKKFIVIENSPQMYIRIIHNNNTSPYATQYRNKIDIYSDDSNYKEFSITSEYKNYADDIILKHYKNFSS